VSNPAESIRTSAIATFEPRDRALSPSEVCAVLAALEHVTAAPTLRSAVKFVQLTDVRKSEFIDASWKEIDFATRPSATKAILPYLRLPSRDVASTSHALVRFDYKGATFHEASGVFDVFSRCAAFCRGQRRSRARCELQRLRPKDFREPRRDLRQHLSIRPIPPASASRWRCPARGATQAQFLEIMRLPGRPSETGAANSKLATLLASYTEDWIDPELVRKVRHRLAQELEKARPGHQWNSEAEEGERLEALADVLEALSKEQQIDETEFLKLGCLLAEEGAQDDSDCETTPDAQGEPTPIKQAFEGG